MGNCPRCGAALRAGQNFCTRCGLSLREAARVYRPASAPARPVPEGGRAAALFVWSLVLFFLLNPVGAPLAALAALLCAVGHAQERPGARALSAARVLCIASTAATGAGLFAAVALLARHAF